MIAVRNAMCSDDLGKWVLGLQVHECPTSAAPDFQNGSCGSGFQESVPFDEVGDHVTEVREILAGNLVRNSGGLLVILCAFLHNQYISLGACTVALKCNARLPSTMHDDGLDQYEDCNITKQNQAGGLSQDLQSGRATHHE